MKKLGCALLLTAMVSPVFAVGGRTAKSFEKGIAQKAAKIDALVTELASREERKNQMCRGVVFVVVDPTTDEGILVADTVREVSPAYYSGIADQLELLGLHLDENIQSKKYGVSGVIVECANATQNFFNKSAELIDQFISDNAVWIFQEKTDQQLDDFSDAITSGFNSTVDTVDAGLDIMVEFTKESIDTLNNSAKTNYNKILEDAKID